MINKVILTIIFLLVATSSTVSAKDNIKTNIEYYSEKLNISTVEVKHLIDFSEKNNIEFDLVFSLLSVETGGTFKHDAIGPQTKYGKAYGIAQFMENTAPWIANMGDLKYKDKSDLFNPIYSIKLCIIYLNYLQYGNDKQHFGYNDWHKSLTAYNRGMTGLKWFMDEKGTPVSSYSDKVLKGAF